MQCIHTYTYSYTYAALVVLCLAAPAADVAPSLAAPSCRMLLPRWQLPAAGCCSLVGSSQLRAALPYNLKGNKHTVYTYTYI